MGNFKDLDVWKLAYTLALHVYRATNDLPPHERYGLTAQLRRAVVSVASNIAEGCGRAGDPELVRFLRIARGSICEVECQLLLIRDLGYASPASIAPLGAEAHRIRRMLTGLIVSLDPRAGRHGPRSKV